MKAYGAELQTSSDRFSKWTEEELLTDADSLLASLEGGIRAAQFSIDFEAYIFTDGIFGRRIESCLIEAANRGVIVRVSVDGVGSRGWIHTVGHRLSAHGVKVKVYHQLFWERYFANCESSKGSWFNLLARINRRNHRKLCVIDSRVAWIGSVNISDLSLKSVMGSQAWREMTIRVQGIDVKYLEAAFELSWLPRLSAQFQDRRRVKKIVKDSHNSAVRLNYTISLRRQSFRELIERLDSSTSRIWIANPYVVPTKRFIHALGRAVERGVDVRVITSARSDVFFMPWVSAVFQSALIERGVKLAAYQPSILHAKYLVIDEMAIIGSSNINRRSLYLDLEADVMTKNPETVQQLCEVFEGDLKHSLELTADDLERQPLWKKIAARLVLFFVNSL